MAKLPAQMIYEFEGFRFDAEHLMLYRGGEEILLAPKAAQTLLTLVERRGEILGKDELMRAIWSDSVVEEANLTQYIHVLRKILGASANGKPLIETLRRRGYRFNGDVRCVGVQAQAAKSGIYIQPNFNGGRENGFFAPAARKENGSSHVSISENSVPLDTSVSSAQAADKIEPPADTDRRILLKTIALAAFAGLLILAVFAFFSSRNTESSAAKNAAHVTLKRLTPDLNARQPTITPDGKYLVYSIENKNLTKTLWLKDLTSGSAVQIMPDGEYLDLAFSPDGTQIYYLTSDFGGPNQTLARIPLFGGKPQIIHKNVISPPAVSPDGKRIAVISGESGLTVFDENGESGNLLESFTPHFTPLMWNSQMSFSPDGERIAVCGKSSDGRPQILDFSINARTGQFLPLPNFNKIDDALWLSDGSGLLVTAKERSGEPYQIWRIAYPSGAARRITNDFNDYEWISLPANSKMLVVGQNITKTNIWTASFEDIENAGQITFGSEAQDGRRGLAFAPDGKIIFTSPRSGNVDLWQMNHDGSSQQPLTANQGSLNIAPRFTPDGRYIVFASSRNGDVLHLWRMDADGQNPLQLTSDINGERFFDVSADGKRIYYATANEQKQMTTRQVSINGGEPSAVADDYQSSGTIAASPDGKLLLRYIYLNGRENPWQHGIFPSEGGEPLKLMQIPVLGNLAHWAADSKSFFFIKSGTAQLWKQPIDDSPPEMVFDLKTGRLFNFAVSRDYKQIVFAHGSQFNEAVLIENFGKQ